METSSAFNTLLFTALLRTLRDSNVIDQKTLVAVMRRAEKYAAMQNVEMVRLIAKFQEDNAYWLFESGENEALEQIEVVESILKDMRENKT